MARKPENQPRQRGVTLIEQIVVVAIVATLSAVAVPALSRLLSRSRLQTAQMDLIAAIQHARETALTTGKVTLLCPTADGRRCRPDNHWEGGWLLAHDIDRDNQPDGAKVLYVGQAYGGKLTIRSNIGHRLMRFQSTGNAAGTNLTLLLCQSDSSESALTVVVSNSGRVRGAPASKTQIAECAGTS